MRVSELASDLNALRAALADEMTSINRYEPLVDSLAHEEARKVFEGIVDDRKRHVALLLKTIEYLDPRQADANRESR